MVGIAALHPPYGLLRTLEGQGENRAHRPPPGHPDTIVVLSKRARRRKAAVIVQADPARPNGRHRTRPERRWLV